MRNNNKIIISALVICLIATGLLGYGMFWQWRSRTVQFMSNYSSFRNDIVHTHSYLARYLENGNADDLEKASLYQTQVFSRSGLFSWYYGNTHGDALTGYINTLFSPARFTSYEGDTEEYLTEYLSSLEQLKDILSTAYGKETHPIPKHNIDRQFTSDLLDILADIDAELGKYWR